MSKLKIYTSEKYDLLVNSVKYSSYVFPEDRKSPWEQIEWIKSCITTEYPKEGEIIILTFSPYILNYINLALAKGDLNLDDIEVFEVIDNDGEVVVESLKIMDNNLIDTRLLSDPISWIYSEYNKYGRN